MVGPEVGGSWNWTPHMDTETPVEAPNVASGNVARLGGRLPHCQLLEHFLPHFPVNVPAYPPFGSSKFPIPKMARVQRW